MPRLYVDTSGAASAWYTWCNSTTATTIVTPITAWSTWNTTSAATSTTGTVWAEWNNQIQFYVSQQRVEALEPLAEEHRRRHATFYAEQEAKRLDAQAKREAAERRAEELLVANLDLRQREQYAKHRAFIVHGRNARYRVRKGRSGNVDVLGKDGQVVDRLCCHPRVWVPDCDTMLAQLLWLSTAEDEFRRKANSHGPGRGELVAMLEAA